MLLPLAQVNLEPEFALSLVIGLVTALGAFFAVKYGGQETQRLVKALHSRFDKMEGRQQQLEINHARLEERVAGFTGRATQRIRPREQDVVAPSQLEDDER